MSHRLLQIASFALSILFLVPSAALAEELEGSAGFGKGFEIESEDGDYLLRIRGYVQPRFAAFFEEEADGDGLTDLGFRVRRGRIYLQGHVFKPGIQFKLQADFARSNPLLDWYGEFDLTEGFALRAGQFKIPFSRQFLASSSSLALVERAVSTDFYTEGAELGLDAEAAVNRDIGLMGIFTPGDFILYLGAFNGNGLNQRGNDDTELAWAARGEWNPLGPVKDKEGAYKIHTSPLLGIGVGAVTNYLAGAGQSVTLGADLAYWSGPFYGQTEFFLRDTGEADDRTGLGFYVQGGWLVLPETGIELAARYAFSDPDVDLEDDSVHQIALGPNWYVYQHDLKVQANYVLEAPDVGDPRHALLVQTTLAFK